MKKRKNQFELSEALQGFLEDAGIEDIYRVQSAIHQWHEIVGEVIAGQTDEVSYEKGILKIQMKTSVWRQEVFMQRNQLLQVLNTWLGEDFIREIQVSG